MQNYKINIKIQGQTPRKSEQQQMKAFYCTTLLYMLYGPGKKKKMFYQNYHLSQQANNIPMQIMYIFQSKSKSNLTAVRSMVQKDLETEQGQTEIQPY